MRASGELTALLRSWSDGDSEAGDRLIEVVYAELRRVAHGQLGREFGKRTLDTTELVHESWLRLGEASHWNGRAHFFGAAARAMRQILVERARSRGALKRGGDRTPVTLDDSLLYDDARASELLDLDDALDRLGARSERAARVVEMRCFVGMTMEEIAEVVGVSLPTVERDWRTARAWLMRELAAAT